jgi:phospholipid/cholesterol/gamma-HCH transport system substrate-binding protein
MERHAHYALVGVISTAVLIAALIFVVWLGRMQFNEEHDRYRILFHGPVRGLSEGGEVQFNGIKVGQIQKIRLDPQDPNRVVTDVELTGGAPVRADSVATMETQGISGVSIIQISAGSPTQPLLKDVSHDRRPIIRSKANALASLLQGGGQMVQSATEALNRVNRVLSDRSIANVSVAIEGIRETSQSLAANRTMFDRANSAITKLDSAATDIQGAAASVRGLADGDGRRAFSDVSDAAHDLKLAVADARSTIKKLDKQSDTTLPNINATMLSLQHAADSLDGLVRQIREDPRGTLMKPRGKEMELPR